MNDTPRSSTPSVLLLGAAAFLAVIWLGLSYNGLAKTNERVDRQWGQVQVQLQRRLDLIPSLVETVQTHMKYEKDTLTAVAAARAKALESLQAAGTAHDPAALQRVDHDQAAVTAALRQVVLVVERYPDLRASQSLQTLQDQLEGTENRISTERMRYNEAVSRYNERLRTLPSNVIANLLHYAPRPYFESKLEAVDPPKLGLRQ